MRNGILMKLLFSFYYLSPMCSFVKDQFPFFIYRCIMFCFLFGKLSSRTMKSIFISRQLSGRVPNGPWDWKNFSVKYFHRDFFVFFFGLVLKKKANANKNHQSQHCYSPTLPLFWQGILNMLSEVSKRKILIGCEQLTSYFCWETNLVLSVIASLHLSP